MTKPPSPACDEFASHYSTLRIGRRRPGQIVVQRGCGPQPTRASACPLCLRNLNTETTEGLSDLCAWSFLGYREHGEENLRRSITSRELLLQRGRAVMPNSRFETRGQGTGRSVPEKQQIMILSTSAKKPANSAVLRIRLDKGKRRMYLVGINPGVEYSLGAIGRKRPLGVVQPKRATGRIRDESLL